MKVWRASLGHAASLFQSTLKCRSLKGVLDPSRHHFSQPRIQAFLLDMAEIKLIFSKDWESKSSFSAIRLEFPRISTEIFLSDRGSANSECAEDFVDGPSPNPPQPSSLAEDGDGKGKRGLNHFRSRLSRYERLTNTTGWWFGTWLLFS